MPKSDTLEGVKVQIERVRKYRSELLGRLNSGTQEFCVICLSKMDFSKSLHIHNSKRYENGAKYTEGCGQTCGECNNPII